MGYTVYAASQLSIICLTLLQPHHSTYFFILLIKSEGSTFSCFLFAFSLSVRTSHKKHSMKFYHSKKKTKVQKCRLACVSKVVDSNFHYAYRCSYRKKQAMCSSNAKYYQVFISFQCYMWGRL